jgi:hypothetical protein
VFSSWGEKFCGVTSDVSRECLVPGVKIFCGVTSDVSWDVGKGVRILMSYHGFIRLKKFVS